MLLFSFLSVNLASFWVDFFDLELEEQIEFSEKDSKEKEGSEKENEEIKDLMLSAFEREISERQKAFSILHSSEHLQLVIIDIPTPPPELG